MNPPRDEPLVLGLTSPDATLDRVGGKGQSLARMAAAGLPVPSGFHLTTHAYRRFVDENGLAEAIRAAATEARADDPATLDRASARIQSLMKDATTPGDVAALIRTDYDDLGPDRPPVAVRSSATTEDLPDLSAAGQQETFLNVRGRDEVVEAVKRCWASLWTARAIGYRARRGIPPDEVALAVVVQRMVDAQAAGVLFTANPLTGARGETVINAAWGLGEAVVGGLVTPDLFIVNTQSGVVESLRIADKDVMTVAFASGTREEAVSADKRRRAALEAGEAAELAQLGARIERLYGRPMDIEWALADGRLFVLQARPITALPEPPVTLDWTLPRAGGRFFRSSVVELLPDPLSPLFATVALPEWNRAMRELMILIAPGFRTPLSMHGLVTINDYAYYDFGLTAWQWTRMLVGMLSRIRTVAKLVLGRAQIRWAEEARPRYARLVGQWTARDLATLSAGELLSGIGELTEAAADYYLVIQSGILPTSYFSETLFTAAYNRLARRQGDPTAVTFLLGFDSAPIQAEKSLYDLAQWIGAQPDLASYFRSANSSDIVVRYQTTASRASAADADAWGEFCRRFSGHLGRFGHAVFDLDFAKSLTADEPAPLVDSLKYVLAGQLRNPHERQSAACAARELATRSFLARLTGLRAYLFTRLLPWAQRYAPLREDALADVGLGWPLVRQMARILGHRLTAVNAIAEADDVFWLKREELEAAAGALDSRAGVTSYREVVEERRARWAREQTVTPPVSLPIKGGMRLMGIDFSSMAPARTDQAAGDTIKGQGASPGRVEGVARVIRGMGEFGLMKPGDILVAKITTPAWTPLFALAGGIVTDVGGPLSHSSIVAREYHIPAVLGTGVATERIRSAQRITVDGDAGLVTLGD